MKNTIMREQEMKEFFFQFDIIHLVIEFNFTSKTSSRRRVTEGDFVAVLESFNSHRKSKNETQLCL